MTTQPIYGLTADQLDVVRDMRVATQRRPVGTGETGGAYNLRVVEVVSSIPTLDASGQRRMWRGRLIDIVNGVPTRGESVWVRNPVPQLRSGNSTYDLGANDGNGAYGSPYYLHGGPLVAKLYAAVYTEDGTGVNGTAYTDTDSAGSLGSVVNRTYPVYTVMSSQSPRLAQIMCAYDDGTNEPQYGWMEMIRSTASDLLVGGPMGGQPKGFAEVIDADTPPLGINWRIKFPRFTTGGTISGTYDGTSFGPFTYTPTGSVALAASIQSALGGTVTAMALSPPTEDLAMIEIDNSDSLQHHLVIDSSALTPLKPRYPARNVVSHARLAAIGVKATDLKGQLVWLWEGKGAFPAVIIEQTAWGSKTTSPTSAAVSSITLEAFNEGLASLTVYQTATGAKVAVEFDYAIDASDLAAAINAAVAAGLDGTLNATPVITASAALAGNPWTVSFSVTGSGKLQDPFVVTASGTDDYGFVWNQPGASAGTTLGWGTQEFVFDAFPDPTYYAPALPKSWGDTDLDGGGVWASAGTADGKGSYGWYGYRRALPTEQTDTGISPINHYVWMGSSRADGKGDYGWVLGYQNVVDFMKPDTTTGHMTFVGGILTGVN